MKDLGNYSQNAVTVTRSVAQPTLNNDTSTSIIYDYSDFDIPTYPLMLDFSGLLFFLQLIIIGVVIGLAQLAIVGFFIFFITKKSRQEYTCPNCGETYKITPWGKIRKCKKCGTSLVTKRCG